MAAQPTKNLWLKRVTTYWASIALGYIFPFLYFFISAGVTRQATKWVMPTLIAGIFLVVKVSVDLKAWTSTWRPSFRKGLLLATPKLLLFVILISVGVVLKWLIEREIETSFYTYFETVIILFGGQSLGAIVGAFHLKYYQLDLIDKGYVLGVVNK
jgi:hypothetical protein